MMFEMVNVPEQKCGSGVEQRVAVLLCYVLGWIGGLIFFLIEKENKFVRFSAMQSIILSAGWFAVWLTLAITSTIMGFIAGGLGLVFTVLNFLVALGVIGLVVLLAVQGWKSVKVKLPIVGQLAEQWSRISTEG